MYQTTDLANGKWIDLSYDFSDETVYWVTAKQFEKETVAEGKTDNGYFYSAYNYSAAEHGGTHIDAPVHFAEGRQTVDQIPLDRLMAPAVKIDVSAKAAENRDYQITVEDLTNWEKTNGQIPDESILFLRNRIRKILSRQIEISRHGQTRRRCRQRFTFSRTRARSRRMARQKSQDQSRRA